MLDAAHGKARVAMCAVIITFKGTENQSFACCDQHRYAASFFCACIHTWRLVSAANHLYYQTPSKKAICLYNIRLRSCHPSLKMLVNLKQKTPGPFVDIKARKVVILQTPNPCLETLWKRKRKRKDENAAKSKPRRVCKSSTPVAPCMLQ